MVLFRSLEFVGNQTKFNFIHQSALLRFTLLILDGNKENCLNLLLTFLLLKSIVLLRTYLQKPVVHSKTVRRKNSHCIIDSSCTQQICSHSESFLGLTHPHKEVISLKYFLLHQSKVARAEILHSPTCFLFHFYLFLAVSCELIRTCRFCKQKDYLPLAIWKFLALVWSQLYNQSWAFKLDFLIFFLVIFMLLYSLVTLQECFVMNKRQKFTLAGPDYPIYSSWFWSLVLMGYIVCG